MPEVASSNNTVRKALARHSAKAWSSGCTTAIWPKGPSRLRTEASRSPFGPVTRMAPAFSPGPRAARRQAGRQRTDRGRVSRQRGDDLALAIRQQDGTAACKNVAAGGIEHDRRRGAWGGMAQRRMDVVGGELADGFEFGERLGLNLIVGRSSVASRARPSSSIRNRMAATGRRGAAPARRGRTQTARGGATAPVSARGAGASITGARRGLASARRARRRTAILMSACPGKRTMSPRSHAPCRAPVKGIEC